MSLPRSIFPAPRATRRNVGERVALFAVRQFAPNLPTARSHLRAQTLPLSGYNLGPRLSIGLTLIFISECGLQLCHCSRYKSD